MSRLKIGLFGVGHLGKIHLKCLRESGLFHIIGFFDPDDQRAVEVSDRYEIKRYDSPDQLIEEADVLDIVTPTLSHFHIAKKCILKGKHVFIEKPLTQTLRQAEELLDLIETYNVKAQVGHVERFNPSFLSVRNRVNDPMFVEAQRLSTFQVRGTDVSVVLDLMIHDIDILLHLVRSPIKKVQASGLAILTSTPDISNARIEFENGCVANLTASRLALKQVRKMNIYETDNYITMDFLKKDVQVVSLNNSMVDIREGAEYMAFDSEIGSKYISFEKPIVYPTNAIKMELDCFYKSIKENTPEEISLRDGYRALKLAFEINDQIKSNELAFAETRTNLF